jgi:hypothetical protein
VPSRVDGLTAPADRPGPVAAAAEGATVVSLNSDRVEAEGSQGGELAVDGFLLVGVAGQAEPSTGPQRGTTGSHRSHSRPRQPSRSAAAQGGQRADSHASMVRSSILASATVDFPPHPDG